MLSRHDISDVHRQRIQHLLPGQSGKHGGVGNDTRLFLNAIRYLAKTGIAWADLPTCYGKSNSLWQHYNRWCLRGVWEKIAAELRDDDTEWLRVDGSCIRESVAAAGAKKVDGTGGQEAEALGRSRGGFGSKIHAAVNSLCQPVKLRLTRSEAADNPQLPALIASVPAQAVVGDKGYDSEANLAAIRRQVAEPCIPSGKNRKQPIPYDRLYNARNVAEHFFGRITQYRRVATRFKKRARNYLGFAWVAAIDFLLP